MALKSARLIGEDVGPTGAIQRLYRLEPEYIDSEAGRSRKIRHIMISCAWIAGEIAPETMVFAAAEDGRYIDEDEFGAVPMSHVIGRESGASFQGSMDFDLALKNLGYECRDGACFGGVNILKPPTMPGEIESE